MNSKPPSELGNRIWREVSQSTSSGEVAQGVSDLLAEYLEHDRFVLVRLDVDHRRTFLVESIARAEDDESVSPEDWTSGSDASFDDLAEWCRTERTVIGTVSEIPGEFDRVCPWAPETKVLVVTLPREDEVGFAAARLTTPDSVDDADDFGALSEPLSATLHYDRGMGDAAAASVERPESRREHFQRVKRRELADVVTDARTGLGDVVDWVRRVAPESEPILLIGEVGTGKEVIARTIHNNSTFANGPMLRVNCGALSEGVIDAKLFGAAADEAFTPATRREPGWFERAEGGTLFLDEIDKLPTSAQRRIADWIETGEIRRPESDDSYEAELRLVAGMHTELDESDAILDELADKLTTFPIHIPPLRARREDIPVLVMQFAENIGRRIGGAPLAPNAEQIELLVEYDWPGNIRELRSVIERAAIIGNGKRLHVEQALGEPADGASSDRDDGEFPNLDEAVRNHLIAALRTADGQVAGEGGAADLLDIHPSTLRSKLKRHDLDPADYR